MSSWIAAGLPVRGWREAPPALSKARGARREIVMSCGLRPAWLASSRRRATASRISGGVRLAGARRPMGWPPSLNGEAASICLGTMLRSLTHTASKPIAAPCCASRRMFCMVAAWSRLGRLKPNSIRPLLVVGYGAVMMAVVADLPDQSKLGVGLVAPGKVGYTAGTYLGFCALTGRILLGSRSGSP